MQILTNLKPIMIAVISISGIMASAKCFFEKQVYQIPLVWFFVLILIGIASNPAILPKLGDLLIKYLCNVLEIKGVV